MTLRWIVIAIVAGLSLAAVQLPDDCDQNLAVADRYWGATRTCLKSGSVTEADVEKMIASPTPLNPFPPNTRPTTKNGQAIVLYKVLVTDPEVRTYWPQTVERLKALLAEERGQNEMRATAHQLTEKVLSPKEMHRLEGLSRTRVWINTLPDGRDVMTTIKAIIEKRGNDEVEIDNNHVQILDLTTGKLLYSVRVPRDPILHYEIAWHTDKRGQPWLYVTGGSEDDDGTERMHLFRWRLGAKRMTVIPFSGNVNRKVENLISISPEMMLADVVTNKRHDYFNLVTGKIAVVPDLSPGPNVMSLEGHAYRYDAANEAILKTKTGRILRATAGEEKLYITDLHDPNFLVTMPFPVRGSAPRELKWVESRGRIFLSVRTYDVAIYEPLVSKEILFQEKRTGADKNNLHIFTSPQGALLVGVQYYDRTRGYYMQIFDGDGGGDMLFEDLGASGWIDFHGQTYYWDTAHHDDSIYDDVILKRVFKGTGGGR